LQAGWLKSDAYAHTRLIVLYVNSVVNLANDF